MAVIPKPKTVDQFIAGGGALAAVPEAITEKDAGVQPVQLRLPTSLVKDIDAIVKNRRPSPSRHQWILEAIYAKLRNETC